MLLFKGVRAMSSPERMLYIAVVFTLLLANILYGTYNIQKWLDARDSPATSATVRIRSSAPDDIFAAMCSSRPLQPIVEGVCLQGAFEGPLFETHVVPCNATRFRLFGFQCLAFPLPNLRQVVLISVSRQTRL